ncbi:hypothetical protein CDAR_228901 [Caerostris darwini]|uniref:Uncharacterized protein n=1 Tax=Caerostris darwini TaxID=1538125 RepID=A0AAV4VNL6_9ARAC|nr:hypothetical protein CDAR_228901 [Caerostris darwini]
MPAKSVLGTAKIAFQQKNYGEDGWKGHSRRGVPHCPLAESSRLIFRNRDVTASFPRGGFLFKNMHKMPPKASLTHTIITVFILRDAMLETNALQIGSGDRENCFSAKNYGEGGNSQMDAPTAPGRKQPG